MASGNWKWSNSGVVLMGHKQIGTWQGKPEAALHYPVRKRLEFVGTEQ